MAKQASMPFTEGGLWNTRRSEFSPETAKLLKTMMTEARINNFQQRQLTSHMLRGESLPENLGPSSTQKNRRPVTQNVPRHTSSQQTRIRSYNDIVRSGAYEKEDYRPRPMKVRTEQEKERLSSIMAYGIDPSKVRYNNEQLPASPPPELDRFDELVNEIEERKTFLDQMISLGKKKEYQQVISNEIAEKIREMELIDKKRTKDLERRLNEQ